MSSLVEDLRDDLARAHAEGRELKAKLALAEGEVAALRESSARAWETTRATCAGCGGAGKRDEEACPRCDGSGKVSTLDALADALGRETKLRESVWGALGHAYTARTGDPAAGVAAEVAERRRLDALAATACDERRAAERERDEAQARLETARAYVASLDHAEGCASEVDGDDAPCDCSVGTVAAMLSAPVPNDVRTLADARASVVMMREAMREAMLDHRAALNDALHRAEALRAIIEGRTTPPTEAEIAAHDRAGGGWVICSPAAPLDTRIVCLSAATAKVRAAFCRGAVIRRWWPLDNDGRPCAWPVVTEAPDGR